MGKRVRRKQPVLSRGSSWSRAEQRTHVRCLSLGPRSWGVGVGETLCLRSCYCHSQEESPPFPPLPQADTETELRDNTEGLTDTGFLRALPHLGSLGRGDKWPRADPSKDPAPAPNHSSNNHEIPPSSRASLSTHKKKEAGFLVSPSAFSIATSSSTRGFWLPRARR